MQASGEKYLISSIVCFGFSKTFSISINLILFVVLSNKKDYLVKYPCTIFLLCKYSTTSIIYFKHSIVFSESISFNYLGSIYSFTIKILFSCSNISIIFNNRGWNLKFNKFLLITIPIFCQSILYFKVYYLIFFLFLIFLLLNFSTQYVNYLNKLNSMDFPSFQNIHRMEYILMQY